MLGHQNPIRTIQWQITIKAEIEGSASDWQIISLPQDICLGVMDL